MPTHTPTRFPTPAPTTLTPTAQPTRQPTVVPTVGSAGQAFVVIDASLDEMSAPALLDIRDGLAEHLGLVCRGDIPMLPCAVNVTVLAGSVILDVRIEDELLNGMELALQVFAQRLDFYAGTMP